VLLLSDIRQKTDSDCGPAAVRCVFDYFDDSRPHREFVNGLLTGEHGTDPLAIEAWVRREGYSVQSGTMDIDDLRHHTRAGRPVIAPVKMHGSGHYVVVRMVARGHVYFQDPVDGPRGMRRGEWLSVWRDASTVTQFVTWGLAIWR
jgi:predicted double-glycine peptidase